MIASNIVQLYEIEEMICLLSSKFSPVRDSNPDYRLPKAQEQSNDLIG